MKTRYSLIQVPAVTLPRESRAMVKQAMVNIGVIAHGDDGVRIRCSTDDQLFALVKPMLPRTRFDNLEHTLGKTLEAGEVTGERDDATGEPRRVTVGEATFLDAAIKRWQDGHLFFTGPRMVVGSAQDTVAAVFKNEVLSQKIDSFNGQKDIRFAKRSSGSRKTTFQGRTSAP